MSRPLESRLRAHLGALANRVPVEPDPDGLIRRSAGRRRRGALTGVAVLAVVCGGAGILTGVGLAGAGSTPAASHAAPRGPGLRSGMSVAPGGAGPNGPSVVVPAQLTLLFTRTTTSGVALRVYTEAAVAAPNCPASGSCPLPGLPPGPVPCPKGAMCAEPQTVPTTGQSGDTGTSSPPGAALPAPTGCGGLVVELSTDRAVSVGTVVPAPATGSGPAAVAVLGGGSFGVAEGAPVGWVAVEAGPGLSSLRLSSAAGVTDQMAPVDGVAVLAQPGATGLGGTDVVGVDGTGAAVATAPADQAPRVSACPSPAPTPSPTTSTTTTTTTTSSTTTTTMPGPPTSTLVPGPPITTSVSPATLPAHPATGTSRNSG